MLSVELDQNKNSNMFVKRQMECCKALNRLEDSTRLAFDGASTGFLSHREGSPAHLDPTVMDDAEPPPPIHFSNNWSLVDVVNIIRNMVARVSEERYNPDHQLVNGLSRFATDLRSHVRSATELVDAINRGEDVYRAPLHGTVRRWLENVVWELNHLGSRGDFRHVLDEFEDEFRRRRY